MVSRMDIDDLIDFINDDKKPPEKKVKKKKPHEEPIQSLTTNDIVQTFEEMKLGNPNQVRQSAEVEDDVNIDTVKTFSEAEKVEIVPKKKKKKKKNKNEENVKIEAESIKDPNITNVKETVNKYKSYFDFSGSVLTNSRYQDNSAFRMIKNWEEKPWGQTNLPTKTIDEQFPKGDYPECQIMEYGSQNVWRSTNEEKKELERLQMIDVQNLRKAAECHRQVRKYCQTFLRPGVKLIDACNKIENMTRFLIDHKGLDSGVGFPTGCSLNNVAAHYTPNPGDDRVLEYDDVCKIDFGSHVNGLIIDCAFTVAFNPTYDELLMAVQEATDKGLKEAGIDVRLGEIGEAIQEVMESYEVTINGKTHPVKAVKNLCGHTIEAYKIHAGKSVPIVKKVDNTKMEEGELYAIETFGSTGKGYVNEDKDCSHYMKDFFAFNNVKIKAEKPRALFNHINKTYSTLAFCRRWLEDEGFPNHALALRALCDQGLVNPYPPLADQTGCYVAQFEHTVLLKPTCKEILSRGDDF